MSENGQLTMITAEEERDIARLVAERRCTREQAAQYLRKRPAAPGPAPEPTLKPLPEKD
ncbi:MAG TPA: hypothetical protein VNZ03_07325 [Terriglobales bacterium]|jgi:hypothetical protein|nr:hypothetical protein [Terriglobales bacterium]